MKKLLFVLFLNPFMLAAQDPKPSYNNDTLYTTCGYKIYKDQILQFEKGTGKKGQFRFINIIKGIPPTALTNNSIVVWELKNVQITHLDVCYVDIIGSIIFKDGSKGKVELQMAYDKAIENDPNLPSELVVPTEFRNSSRVKLHEQLNKLFILFASGAISKTEYEAQKKKLLE